jgi:hypothetical protein
VRANAALYEGTSTLNFEATMKTLLLSLTVALTATALCGAANATTHRSWYGRHAYAGPYTKVRPYRDRNDDTLSGYYEHRLDAVRFGSQRWWRIYDEQNGGGQRR